jgi:signal transduction histidine kinase/methyl-accepting chemotaxis protein
MKTSLRAKLVRTMIATLVVVSTATLLVVAAMNFLSARRALKSIEARLRESITRKGTSLVTFQAIGLRDLVMDNAFGDVARIIERTVEKDDQLVFGLFLDGEEKAWAYATHQRAAKAPEGWKQLNLNPKRLTGAVPGQIQVDRRQLFGQTVFEFSVSVVDDKGTALGGLTYGLSDRPLQEALADARSDSRHALLVTVGLLLLLGCVTIVMGAVRSRQAAARITQPVTDLTQAANKLASGDRDIRVQIASGDELEILGGAFNHMAAELKESCERLEAMNRTLEVKVQERTHELEERNRHMRRVLDNVNQGFLTVSDTGKLAQEHSAIVDQWFGPYQGEVPFDEYIAKSDPIYAFSFQIGYEAVVEGILPRELCIQQMPARLRRDGREYRCAYFPIQKADKFEGLLIVINDVTAELLHARQEAERKEILAMFEALTRDRTGFMSFMDEAEDIFTKQLHSDDLALQKRGLHTLKGNAGLVGFGIIAKLCHDAEDELTERITPLPKEALEPLEKRWRILNEALRSFLGDKGREVLELATKEVEALEQEIRAGEPTTRILDRLASWWLEAAELPLRRLARYAVALTARLGKGDLEIDIESNGVRLAPKAWAGFWTDLVHVVRNAVDHGLETTSERAKSGKDPPPRMRFSSAVFNRRLVIEIEDYGRGVNWEAVRQAAAKRGLPSATEDDLVHAMFSSGVSTSASVTSLSGRGEGLAAVRQQVDDLGGHITVTSKPGRGTCFRFVFHLPEVGPRFGVDTSERVADA